MDGRKTQTRRVLRVSSGLNLEKESTATEGSAAGRDFDDYAAHSPYGTAGDRLWVKETHYVDSSGGVVYRADVDADNLRVPRWSPSIFMPRWASRLTLGVVKVRVERLQAATDADFIAEGIGSLRDGELGYLNQEGSDWRSSYRELWDSLNAERGFAWDVNPWVWVVEFTRL